MSKGTPNPPELFKEPITPGVILTDKQITQLVNFGSLIEPFEPRGLDSCSYDVRIGGKAVIGGQGQEIDLTNQKGLELMPGGYAAVVSLEKVNIPPNIVVRINSKRSFSYEGIARLTGTQVDPGYKGHLLFGFYNASSKKVVLRQGRAICSLIFEALAGPVDRPKPPDPDLLDGNFPLHFVNQMANMEVLSWHQLTQHVKEIDKIATDLLELRGKYENVVEPIKDLTTNVTRLSGDVDKLSITIRTIGDQVGKLEGLTNENARQVTQISNSIQLLVGEVGYVKKDGQTLAQADEKQDSQISDLARKFGTFSVLVYIFWGVLLVVLGVLLKKYVFP
jgi:deoxycytidine triphosphate deaminase